MARTFGEYLRELRRAKGLSQRELAARVGVDFSYISKAENDRISPPAGDTVVRICEALGVPPDELLALSGKVPSNFTETLRASPAALGFMREAHAMSLSEEEWRTLGRRLKGLRGN